MNNSPIMNYRALTLCATWLILSTINYQPSTCFAQGSLTPPGPPAPTMKTLDQIEPRTPIDATHTPGNAGNLFVINASGSYYLAGNITGVSGKSGILINAHNVTVDLNGFALIGVAGTISGIAISGTVDNLVIRNGSITSWGSLGINAFEARNSHFHQLQVRSNGSHGLEVGVAARVTECGAINNGGDGIRAPRDSVIQHCSASTNVGNGITSTGGNGGIKIIGCDASNNNRHGISGSANCTLTDCTTNGNGASGGRGIETGPGNTLTNCVANLNDSGGISAGTGSTLSHCTTYLNTTFGISVPFSGNTFTNCTATLNTGDGIVTSTGSTLINCTAKDNQGIVGISAGEGSTLTNCTAFSNDVEQGIEAGQRSTLTNCTASGNTSAAISSWGISAGAQSTISNCTASGNTNTNGTPSSSTGGGILAGTSSTVQNCTVANNKGDGIQIVSDSRVTGNNCDSNGLPVGGDAAGIHSTNSDNRIEGNNVTDNTRGIDVDSAGSLIIKNSASGNTTNYEISASNAVGVIVNAPASVAISGSTGGAGVGSADPWTNISY